MAKLKLEIGKVYVDRDGSVSKIVKQNKKGNYVDHRGASYTENGYWINWHGEVCILGDDDNLVKEAKNITFIAKVTTDGDDVLLYTSRMVVGNRKISKTKAKQLYEELGKWLSK